MFDILIQDHASFYYLLRACFYFFAMTAILDQDLITIKQATTIIPTHPHVATVWRWLERGCRGHRLQSWLVGGQRYTSREAIEDFLAKLNAKDSTTTTSVSKSRQRAIESADRELSELGL